MPRIVEFIAAKPSLLDNEGGAMGGGNGDQRHRCELAVFEHSHKPFTVGQLRCETGSPPVEQHRNVAVV